MFIQSSYWGTWSRILGMCEMGIVEVNLTPIPGCYTSSWEKDVLPIRIRAHNTHEKNQPVKELPPEVMGEMLKHLPLKIINTLLRCDILPLIDWEKWKKFNNGGANFEDIKK